MSTAVTPSRALQTMTDILVRAAPSKARSVNERMQADDIYKAGISLRVRFILLSSWDLTDVLRRSHCHGHPLRNLASLRRVQTMYSPARIVLLTISGAGAVPNLSQILTSIPTMHGTTMRATLRGTHTAATGASIRLVFFSQADLQTP